MLGELDSLLRGMRVGDGSSYGMAALTTGHPGQKIDALATWESWQQIARPGLVHPTEIRSIYLLVDFSFLAAYTVVFLGAIAWLWRRIEGNPKKPNGKRRPWLELVNLFGWLLFALVVADVLENLGLFAWTGIKLGGSSWEGVTRDRRCCGWQRSCHGSSLVLVWYFS